MDKIRSFIAKHEILSFFLLTFIISWGMWIPLARLYYREGVYTAGVPLVWGVFGPALAGISITRLLNPRQEGKSRRKPALVFCLGLVLSALVSFTFSYFQLQLAWTTEVLLAVVIMSVLIAIPPAYVISSAFAVNQTVREYLQTLIKPRGELIYYLIALLAPPAMYWIGSLLSNVLGQSAYWNPPPLIGWIGMRVFVLTFIYHFFYGNTLGEEVGWRGFALPRLQARYNPLGASLIIAFAWFPWHLPLKMANPDALPYLFYALTFIPSSIFLTWIYNRTKGSLLAVGLAHIANNMGGELLFPITNAWLIITLAGAMVLILMDRMWKKLPSDHPAVFRSFGQTAQKPPAIELDRRVEVGA